MKADIAKRWADALESGKYDQGRSCLERRSAQPSDDDGFCCLGVLCALAVEDGVAERKLVQGSIFFGSPAEHENRTYGTSFPPESVLEWAGLGNENPVFDVDIPETCEIKDCGGHSTSSAAAAELNDDKGFTFEQIAALIREQYDKL
jgi:hypothetical protein